MSSQSTDNNVEGNTDSKDVEQNSRLIKSIMYSLSGKSPSLDNNSDSSNGVINSDAKDGNNSDSNGGNNSDNSGLGSMGNSMGFNYDEGMSSNSKEGQNDSNDDSDEANMKLPASSASLASLSKKKKKSHTVESSGTEGESTPVNITADMKNVSTSMPPESSLISTPEATSELSKRDDDDAAADIAVANLRSIVSSYADSSNNSPNSDGRRIDSTTATKTAIDSNENSTSINVAADDEVQSRKRTASSNNADVDDGDSGGYNTDDDDIDADEDGQDDQPNYLTSNNDNLTDEKTSKKHGRAGAKPTKAGAPQKKKARDSSKREERNQREKERSLRISKQIGELRTLLSSGGVVVPKGTKSSVLTEAANYIKMLQQHQYRSEM